MHGFQVVGTNANVMAIRRLREPGDDVFRAVAASTPWRVCGFWGLMHHAMVGKLIVK